jgi:hypothetical protein
MSRRCGNSTSCTRVSARRVGSSWPLSDQLPDRLFRWRPRHAPPRGTKSQDTPSVSTASMKNDPRQRLQSLPCGHAAAHNIPAQGLADGAGNNARGIPCQPFGRYLFKTPDKVTASLFRNALSGYLNIAVIGHDDGGVREFFVCPAEMGWECGGEIGQINPALDLHRDEIDQRHVVISRQPNTFR